VERVARQGNQGVRIPGGAQQGAQVRAGSRRGDDRQLPCLAGVVDDCRQGSAGQVFSSNGKQGGIARV